MNIEEQRLILALPSKGRLQEQSFNFLSGCGFDVRRIGNGREYTAKLAGIDKVDIIYFRPDEIPIRIDQGDAHLGITGEDLYLEFGDGQSGSHLLMPRLGFGAARLVVAVPQSWVDVTSMDDLEEVALLFHQKRGRSLRIATKFSRLTRAFFADRGIVEYTLVESLGATEGAPSSGVADLIVDLTSTGATLAQNHLKEVTGGTVLRTEACLVASLRAGLWTAQAMAALEQIVEQVEARTRATSKLVLRFSIPSKKSSYVRTELTTRYECSLTSWSATSESVIVPRGGTFDFVVALCTRTKLYAAVKFLKSSGAAEIIVDRSEFVFEETSQALERFRQLIRRQDTEGRSKSVAVR
jgi:ATP phosphoribosyltransferase